MDLIKIYKYSSLSSNSSAEFVASQNKSSKTFWNAGGTRTINESKAGSTNILFEFEVVENVQTFFSNWIQVKIIFLLIQYYYLVNINTQFELCGQCDLSNINSRVLLVQSIDGIIR